MKSHYKNMHRILFFLIFIIMLLPIKSTEGAMGSYCAIPPFLSQSIPPNVLIVLDNSGSMCDQAYAGSYDPTQFDNGLYYGYFDGAKNYRYNNPRWEETTDAMTTGTADNPIATGSFLNWATMRRVEVAKKLLVGGKGNPRSPSPGQTVKLDGEIGCGSSWDFDKSHDTSAGGLIYPFAGNYRFERTGDDLYVTPVSGGSSTFYTYPTSDISLPSGWSEYPVSGALIAWTKVDEATSDSDTTYIQNNNTTSPVIMGFNYTQSEPSGNISVRVQVRAKKTASGSTRNVAAVLRIDGTDYESNTSSIGTGYSLYTFTWETNPATAAPWTWDQITGIAASGNLQGIGVKAAGNYTSRYPRITQVYLDISVTTPTGGPFNTIVDQGMVKAEGIIDTLTSDVRFGLTYYNSSEAAHIPPDGEYIDFGVATNMITSINNMVPSTWTPLAETLYEMIRYFRQDAPYYSNSPADYSVAGTGANMYRDPYWYQFSDLDSNLTDMYVPCAKSFVLFLTDGESTQDTTIPGSGSGACSLSNIKRCSVDGDLPDTRYAGTVVGTTYPSNGTDYMIDAAYWARTNDMRPGAETDVPTTWRQSIPGTQNVITYPVYMFGQGSTLLKDTSIYGGFVDMNGNNKPDCTTIPAECYRDTDGDGTIESNGQDNPLTYYEGSDGYALEQSIKDAINDILKRSSSGTAASVLASGEGSGANLVQALFYPKRTFEAADISWIGYLKNLWYYMDPFFAGSSIMDDYSNGTTDKILDLSDDCTIAFTTSGGNVQVIKGGACADETIDVDDMSVLWEAGKLLHSRTPGDTNPGPITNRTIFTTTDGTTRIPFETPANATLQTLLQASGNQDLADRIVSYTRGTDYNSSFCSSTVTTSCALDADCPGGETCINYRNRTVTIDSTTDTWKLGDIISSTPKIVSWTPLNGYYKVYKDQSYKTFSESTTNGYKNRGMVFVGANDGMLHAFYLGKLELSGSWKTSSTKKAKLTDPSNIGLGKEIWSFIPKNTLPYLQYMADPDYCHIYSIDATPYIFEASINGESTANKTSSSWRTVLIGGMRLGGACKDTTYAGTTGVTIPAAGMGYSSYFALDITDTVNHPDDPVNYPPQLLWEFSHADLGYSTTGPAIVKISAETDGSPDKTKNGKWFVVFGSGPTGPIDTTTHQFKGFSDQQLKLFVFDVEAGPGTGNTNVTTITPGTAITYAFAGSMWGSPIDVHQNNPSATGNYQDDALYFGYTEAETKPPTSATKWTKGGVLRLLTNESDNPSEWVLSKVIDNIGPVTAEVAKLQNYSSGKLWLYFGTGRYYYKTTGEIDDANSQRKLYGIKEPCFSSAGFEASCSTISEASLTHASTGAGTTDPDGWFIELDPYTDTYKAERVIASPTTSTIGVVFFPTAKPSADICTYGGATHLWAVDYDTGGAVNRGLLKGKALIQVSSGSIEQIDLSEAFPNDAEHKDGRRTGMIDGLAVAAPPIITPPKAVKRTVHIKER